MTEIERVGERRVRRDKEERRGKKKTVGGLKRERESERV